MNNPQQHSEVVLMTPEMARYYLEVYTYDKQRPVRDHHVQRYAREMKAGRFRISTIRTVKWEDRLHLTDGQHRLWAVIESGVSVPMAVLRITAQCAEDLAEDYSVTDTGLGRHATDAHRAYDLAEELSLPPYQLNFFSGCIRLISGGFAYATVRNLASDISPAASRRALRDWAPQAREYFGCMHEIERPIAKVMSRAPVLAVALVTLRYQPVLARKFWAKVMQNDGLRRGTTERALIDRLLNTPSNSMPAYIYARIPSHAWNAYFERRDIGKILLREGTGSEPILIAGTPYTGRSVLRMDYEASEKPEAIPVGE